MVEREDRQFDWCGTYLPIVLKLAEPPFEGSIIFSFDKNRRISEKLRIQSELNEVQNSESVISQVGGSLSSNSSSFIICLYTLALLCDFIMGPRRSHRKSRNGCPECKTRRVKVLKVSTISHVMTRL